MRERRGGGGAEVTPDSEKQGLTKQGGGEIKKFTRGSGKSG